MKRLAMAIGALCVMNMLALAGLAAYAWSAGWLERERVLEAVAVLTGQAPAATEEEETTVVARPSGKQATTQPADAIAERIRLNDEMDARHRIELERREREIKNLWSHLESRELALLRAKEELEAAKQRFAEQQAALAAASGNDGLLKELEILSGIPAKDAKALLRGKDEADVVRIIRRMDQRRVARIVRECKTEEERLWIGRIMEKLHDSDVAQAEVLGAG